MGYKRRWYIDFRIWSTDKQAFIRKQYTAINRFKTLTKRKTASLAALKEIKKLLAEGIAVGTPSNVEQNRFDLKNLLFRKRIPII